MKIRWKFFLLMTFVVCFAFSANSFSSANTVQEYREKHEHQILKEFMKLLSIPNVSSDRKNIRKNAEFIKTMMEKRSIETRILETEGNPVIYGELNNPQVEQNWDSLLEAIQYPALNVNGIQSGWVGDQARTIIPPSATAHLDIRMVKGNEPEDMRQKVINHIKAQGYKVVSEAPDKKTRMKHNKIARVVESEKGYKAYKTPMDSTLAQNVIHALKEHNGKEPVLPSLGVSLPIHLFHETLGVPIIGIPIANHDNNQHQQDENLRIGHLWTGIETYASIIMNEQE